MEEAETQTGMSQKYVQNFWVCASPFLSSSLFLQSSSDNQNENYSAFAQFFDSDGELFNELQVNFADSPAGLLDLEPFLAECKFESGMKYARLKIHTQEPTAVALRLQSRDWSVISTAAQKFSATEKYLIAVEQDSQRSNWIVVLNDNSTELDIRVRLFLAKRSPEVDLKVPAYGARVFDAKTLFEDIFSSQHELVQSYIRVSAVGTESAYIQSINIPTNAKLPRVFSILV